MATVPLTRSKHLMPFAAVLKKRGEPVERLLRTAVLPSACLDDPETLIPVGATANFRELTARRTGLPNIALTATEHLGFADLGESGQPVLKAPTLQRSLSEFRKLLASQTSNLAIEIHPMPGGHLSFRHRVLSEVGEGDWHRALYVLSWMLKAVHLVDSTWSPTEIWVDATASPARFEAIETLGAAARFGHRSTGFFIPASMLALPPAKSSAVQHEWSAEEDPAQAPVPAKKYAEALGQLIRSYAGDGWLSVEQASQAANTSMRTMQRRLSAEQKTYSSVLEQTRAEMASEMLESTDATMAEIAHELGYKNPGDFTGAFRRWAEVTPSEFRRQRQRN